MGFLQRSLHSQTRRSTLLNFCYRHLFRSGLEFPALTVWSIAFHQVMTCYHMVCFFIIYPLIKMLMVATRTQSNRFYAIHDLSLYMLLCIQQFQPCLRHLRFCCQRPRSKVGMSYVFVQMACKLVTSRCNSFFSVHRLAQLSLCFFSKLEVI